MFTEIVHHRQFPQLWSIVLAALVITGISDAVQAQIDEDDVTIAGVYVDADGMMRVRAEGNDRARRRPGRAIARDGELVYISLPRLFAKAREQVESGEGVTADLRTLGGMTRLQYIFIFPDARDIVIAGPAEAVDFTNPRLPVGKLSGRPVLRMDDVVMALRTVGPAAKEKQFGCSLDMPEGAMERAVEAHNRNLRASRKERMAAVVDAVGPQEVRIFGVQADTTFAFAMLNADYRLKRLGLGQDPTPVPSVRHSVSGKGARVNRWWFKTTDQRLAVSPDQQSYALIGQSLKVDTAGHLYINAVEASASAKRFAEQCTEHFDRLAMHIPAFADLENVTDLALLAALVRKDDLHTKVKWDLQWLMNEQDGYPVTRIRSPQSAETLIAHLGGGLATGGVLINHDESLKNENREVDESIQQAADRPDDEQWREVKERPDSAKR